MKEFKILLLFVLAITFGAQFSPLQAAGTRIDDSTTLQIGSVFRSYLVDDQRIQWSGMETTFGVEAAVTADIRRELKRGTLQVLSELFFNQPFDQNRLTDERRARYLANFEYDTFEIAQLLIRYSGKNISIGLGRQTSPFGRNRSLPLSNAYIAQPFIRTEAILRYETGLFFEYNPGILEIALAVVNGSSGMDTNSSKGGIARVGLKGRNWGLGISAKFQDGIGSEWQKQYKNHAGADWMVRIGSFTFFGEVIYDEYGFHRDFNEDDIFWERSLYYRDLFYKHKTPITGIGGYAGVQFEGSRWFLEINYGEYHPEEIGRPFHDDPIKRAIVKMRLRLAARFHLFAVGLFENKRQKEELFAGARDYALLLGLQYTL